MDEADIHAVIADALATGADRGPVHIPAMCRSICEALARAGYAITPLTNVGKGGEALTGVKVTLAEVVCALGNLGYDVVPRR